MEGEIQGSKVHDNKGDTVETIVGLSYVAHESGGNLPLGFTIVFGSEEAHEIWSSIWTLFSLLGVPVTRRTFLVEDSGIGNIKISTDAPQEAQPPCQVSTRPVPEEASASAAQPKKLEQLDKQSASKASSAAQPASNTSMDPDIEATNPP